MISFIVPYRESDPWRRQSFEFVHGYLSREWAGAEVIVSDALPDLPFDRARSRNEGAELATGDVLVFVDADSVPVFDQVNAAIAAVDGGLGWVYPYDRYQSLTQESSQDFIAARPEALEFEYVFPSEGHPEPSVGGCVVVSREAFDTVGGYDDRFVGWGEEDRAFQLSLKTMVWQETRVHGPIFHLWHPHPEDECFGQPYFQHNRDLCNMYRNALDDPARMAILINSRA